MNTGGQAFPGPHWSEGETGMTLLDWMAGQEAISDEDMGWPVCEHHAGPRPSGDWKTNPIEWHEWEARWRAGVKYTRATAMLAEKARREADHSEDALGKVPSREVDNDYWAKFQHGILISFEPTHGWCATIPEGSMGCGNTIAEAVANLRARWEEKNVVPDHSPDGYIIDENSIPEKPAGKMAALESANRELVEALESIAPMIGSALGRLRFSVESDAQILPSISAIIAKHKATK